MTDKTMITEEEIANDKALSREKGPPLEPTASASHDQARKAPGQAMFSIRSVPADFQEEIRSRFGSPGRELAITPARENGTYRGEVFNSKDFLAQRVGEGSVVLHDKGKLEFLSQNHVWRDANERLNGTKVLIAYNADKAKVYPWDPQREALTKLVSNMKAMAKELGLNESFLSDLDKVRDAMLTKMKAQRPEQAPAKPAHRTHPSMQR